MGPRHFHEAGKVSKSRQNKLIAEEPGSPSEARVQLLQRRSPHSAPAVSGSTAGAFIWMEVGRHSPFIEYLTVLWWPLVQRESNPQAPLR